MPVIAGEFRSVSIEEWLSGTTLDGHLLDPDKADSYRRNRNLDPLPGFRRASAATRKSFNIDRPQQFTTASTQLVGDELTKLIKEYNLTPKKSCGCDSWAAQMNEWGSEGCSLHRAEIIAHLNEAYHAATWWETLTAAGSAAYKSLPLTLGGMVDEAIRRTETSLGN